MQPRKSHRQAGMTLIELLVTVAIVGILSAIAYPSYNSYLIKSRRAQATACIHEAAQYMERFYTTNLRYDQATDGTAVALPVTSCVQDMNGNYVLSIPAVSANSFTLRATPQGNQASRDTQCGNLTLTQTGTKSVSGTGTAASCW